MGNEAHPTRALAEWLCSLSRDDLPDVLVERLRLLLLDCLGAALHGRGMPWPRMVAAWAGRAAPEHRDGLASAWGEDGARLRPCDAALVNGTAAHAFELDDFHNAKLHPGAVIVPTVLALCEARAMDGGRALTAIAAGYEIMIRLALALGPGPARLRGWHLTSVCGSVGAAASAAKLLGLDSERTAWALGLGGTQSGGLFAFNADGAMSKRLHPGRAAQSGVMAAELAELGFTGPTRILEAADGGWLSAFCDSASQGPLLDGLGSRWEALDTSFKPYACCGSLHSHVDAALELRPRWRPGARVRVGLAKVVDVQCGYDYAPGTVLNAQMSARYCVAAALREGSLLPAQFTADLIADPDLVALAKHIELVVDPALDDLYPRRFAGWVEVEEDAGTGRFAASMRHDPSGNPSSPLWGDNLRHKFRVLVQELPATVSAAGIEGAVANVEAQRVGETVRALAGANR